MDDILKYKIFFYITIFAVFTTCLTVFPSGGASGALKGIKICYSIIIPSLFPFAVASLVLFKLVTNIRLPKVINAISRKFLGIDNELMIIFFISLIGGYPVGAKLLEKAYTENLLTKSDAELMLGYCVNSGPSFIIIAVGSGVLNRSELGFLLLVSNILTSIIIAIAVSRKIGNYKKRNEHITKNFVLADELVSATYEAANAMIGICSFIIIFSSFISTLESIFSVKTVLLKHITLLLEITNGIVLAEGNILLISFLLGFSGICVHLQVLSMCVTLRPNYIKFLFIRITHGILSAFITYLLLKITKLPLQTIALGNEYLALGTRYSAVFSFALIICATVFIASIRKNYKRL